MPDFEQIRIWLSLGVDMVAARIRRFSFLSVFLIVVMCGPVSAHMEARSVHPLRVSACSNDDIVPWLNTFLDGSAGTFTYSLVFTNVSPHTCFLGGFAGVSAVTRGGAQIGAAAVRGSSSAGPNLQIAPGQEVFASLSQRDPGIYGSECQSRTAYGLRVYVPNQFAYEIIPFPLDMCAQTSIKMLTIYAIQGRGMGPTPTDAAEAPRSGAHSADPRLVSQCTNDQIVPWLDTISQGILPGVAYNLEFTNVSSTKCYLKGYPGVSAVTRSGVQIGAAATRDSDGTLVARQIAPGGTVTAIFDVRPQGLYTPSQCENSTAFAIKVYVPDQFPFELIPYPLPVCANVNRNLLAIYPIN